MSKTPKSTKDSIVRKTLKMKRIDPAEKFKYEPGFFEDFFMISDIHMGLKLGSEEWIENCKKYFNEFFFPLIKEKKKAHSIVICLGDIFDDRKNINIAVNDMAIDIFEEMAKILPVYIINGNHDMYKKSDNTITSLRSFDNIPNLTVIKEPTIISLNQTDYLPIGQDEYGTSTTTWKTLGFIPYQGDIEKETDLANSMRGCSYIFMHTDIQGLRYDNGREITKAVEIGKIKGHVYSGHIHRRQDGDRITYIGSPYQLRRSDIGNQKGIYHVDMTNDKVEFYENKFSPIFQKVQLSDLLKATYKQAKDLCHNNYTDIYISAQELPNLNITKLYEVLDVCKPKRIEIKVLNKDEYIDEDDSNDYSEKSISEIIDNLIDQLEVDQSKKDSLKKMSLEYQSIVKVELD